MHIISKYKDYYDGIAGQTGIDKSVVFERHTSVYPFSTKKVDRKNWWRPIDFPKYGKSNAYKAGEKTFDLFLVGFCGKIYIAARMVTYVPCMYSRYGTAEAVPSYIYGLEKIKAEVCSYYQDSAYFHKYVDKNLDHLLTYTTDPKILELFYTYNTPQFAMYSGGGENLQINACLKDIEFYKVFDPFMAFQEIEMYITGVLGVNNKPTVEISDRHKIEGHGFDYKYSFRKEPSKK